MLDDAFFDFFETVVVLVELTLGVFEIEVVGRVFAPRQVGERFEVVVLYREVGRLRVETFQPAQLLVEDLLHLFAPFLLGGFLRELFDVLLLTVASQFVLYGFYLLLQEMFPLLLVDVGSGFRLDIGLYFEQLGFLAQGGIEGEGPFLYRGGIEKLLLLLGRERYVGAQEIDQIEHISHVAEGEDEFAGRLGHRFQHIERNIFQGVEQRFKFFVVLGGEHFGVKRNVACDIGVERGYLVEVKTLFPLQNHRRVAVGHFQYLDDFAQRTDRVEVVDVARVIVIHVFLTDNAYEVFFPRGFTHQTQRFLPSHGDGKRHAGKKHHVAQWQNGQIRFVETRAFDIG